MRFSVALYSLPPNPDDPRIVHVEAESREEAIDVANDYHAGEDEYAADAWATEETQGG